MHPSRFLVWRPAVNAYMMYAAVYDEDGNVVKFIGSDMPHFEKAKLHEYVHPYVHNISLKVGDGHYRYFDLVERSCVQIINTEMRANGTHTLREFEIPVLEFERHQILPREFGGVTLSC